MRNFKSQDPNPNRTDDALERTFPFTQKGRPDPARPRSDAKELLTIERFLELETLPSTYG